MTPSKSAGSIDQVRAADADLVARCQAGDSGAFEELYRQHGRRLYNLACRMLGDPADAEDLLQEIFLTAYRKLGSFKGQAALSTWLYRLGMNQCLDRLRSKAGRMKQATASIDEAPLRLVDSRRESTISRMDLERAIAQLPEGCRSVFLLHDVEGFDHREVGEMLGIAEGTSKSQVHKARLKIREFLSGA